MTQTSLISKSASAAQKDNNEFLITTEILPIDMNFMPSLSNGHIGYTVFGDAIYMNGIYNGYGGDSRRARIPNWLNVSVNECVIKQNAISNDRSNDVNIMMVQASPTTYTLNTSDGYFRWQQTYTSGPSLVLSLEQRTYPHRYYNRALVYELFVSRTEVVDEIIELRLIQKPGVESKAFDFSVVTTNAATAAVGTSTNANKFYALKGVTKCVEHEQFQKEPKTIYINCSEELKENMKILTMAAGQKELYYRYIITVDEVAAVAHQEMEDILSISIEQLLAKHATAWYEFWNDFNIKVSGGNMELAQIINAGIFYLASSLPSLHSNQPNNAYYGLSPTGLGRGELDDDYEGHNFWDTEIWMLPAVTHFSIVWAEALLQYRLQHLAGAQYNAISTGYKGARFPWESAFTGTEVTNPGYPEVAAQQVHISADIAFALQQHYATTNNDDWLCAVAWPLLQEIATFLESRVEFDAKTQKYCIRDVMGPDEDHQHVNDNVYTNVIFKIAFEFASFTQKKCAPTEVTAANQWLEIAQNLNILYDDILDYHPQYLNFTRNEIVKQADTILLGYPLQYPMQRSTHLNDLNCYEKITRASGPAMTWSMFAINFLQLNELEKGNFYFTKGYKDYVRPEFKVWSETRIGYQGSSNFLTGVGGFLQSIIYGYGGIRIYRNDQQSVMIIKEPHVLPDSTAICIKGIKFANSTFALEIRATDMSTTLTCLTLGNKKLELLSDTERHELSKGFTIKVPTNKRLMIQTI